VAADARSRIVAELAAEYVEERVRHRPAEPFQIDDLKLALVALMHDADAPIALKPSDDTWLAAWLDRHPFLLRTRAGRGLAWKPGLNTQAAG
jgi:hypothetical protein